MSSAFPVQRTELTTYISTMDERLIKSVILRNAAPIHPTHPPRADMIQDFHLQDVPTLTHKAHDRKNINLRHTLMTMTLAANILALLIDVVNCRANRSEMLSQPLYIHTVTPSDAQQQLAGWKIFQRTHRIDRHPRPGLF